MVHSYTPEPRRYAWRQPLLCNAQDLFSTASLDKQALTKPRKQTFCNTIRKNFHWKCLILTLMLDGCIAVLTWCQMTLLRKDEPDKKKSYLKLPQSTMKGPCDQGYNFIPIAFALMLYIVYLMECWHCKIRLQLKSKVDSETIYNRVTHMQEALPIVWWRALCYHYIRRTRQVTRYRNGDAVTTTQVYYERINSHSAGAVFLYHECGVKDISQKLTGLEDYALMKIRFSKGFVFANLQAANDFEEQRARFFQENEQRDDYMEVREGLDLLNTPFKEFLVSFSSAANRPWYTLQSVFWIASLALLSWPLRLLIELKTAYVHYHVTKLFGTNYLSPNHSHYTGPLRRMNTMDSGDLDEAIRNNFVIVPSYSEALLMDPVNTHATVRQDRQGNWHVHARQRYRNAGGSSEALTNEGVIANYGALLREGLPLLFSSSRRSRSLSFVHPRNNTPVYQYPEIATSSTRPHRSTTGLRSFSFGSLATLARRAGIYRTLPTTPEELVEINPHLAEMGGQSPFEDSVPEEPPPPYEIALQMCRPLYSRLKRSITSESAKIKAVAHAAFSPLNHASRSLRGHSSRSSRSNSKPSKERRKNSHIATSSNSVAPTPIGDESEETLNQCDNVSLDDEDNDSNTAL